LRGFPSVGTAAAAGITGPAGSTIFGGFGESGLLGFLLTGAGGGGGDLAADLPNVGGADFGLALGKDLLLCLVGIFLRDAFATESSL
jgi:hypothetical protein